MKNVLLVDTNFSAAPLYNYINEKGFNVFVCGGNPFDYLAKAVNNYIKLDYSDIDNLFKISKELQIDYIVPGCNDLSYQVCARLNKKKYFFGIDAPETAQLINNKKKFRKIATNLGLPVPKIFSHDNLSAFWPVIVKPVDAYSGRGVTVVRESEQEKLPSAIQKAEKFSRTGTCVIEEYVEGQLYSHSAFIADRKILADFIVEEHSTANSFVVDTSRVIYDFPKEILLRIRKIIQLLASKLNLVDGLIHTQFIKNEDVFWLIEITRRCPGDLYSKLIESSTAFPYVESYVRPFLNQPVMFENSIKQTQYYVLRHTISQPSGNLFSSIRFNRSVEIENLIFLALSGDNVKESPFGRIALLFAKANSEEELCGLMDSALKRELYKINSNIF